MTAPKSTDEADTDRSPEAANRGVRVLPLLGACLACCVPMLLVLGVVSIGAALAGAIGLTFFIVLIVAATVIAPRLRRR